MTKEIWSRNVVWKTFTTDLSACGNRSLAHITLLPSWSLRKLPQNNAHYEKLLVLIDLHRAVLLLMWMGMNPSPRAPGAGRFYQWRLSDWLSVLQHYSTIVTKLLLLFLSNKNKDSIIRSWSFLWFLHFLHKDTLKLVGFFNVGNAEPSSKC